MANDSKKIFDEAAAKQHTFTIEGEGEFTLRRPNFADTMAIGKKYTMYCGGQTLVDYDAAGLARIRATLDVTAEGKPAGFDFDTVLDFSPLFAFYGEYIEWLNTFRRAGAGTADGATGTGTPVSSPVE